MRDEMANRRVSVTGREIITINGNKSEISTRRQIQNQQKSITGPPNQTEQITSAANV